MDVKTNWESGKADEAHFWRQWLPNGHKVYFKPLKLRSYFGEMIGDKKKVSILDLGSGPVPTLGYTWNDIEIDLTLSDVLANEYNEMYKNIGVTPIFPIVYQDMTNITYPDNKFDIVHCRNALDHCQDPIKAIGEMVRVCKPGGWIYLAHFARVGKKSRYHGFHQWNLDEYTNNDLIIWNLDTKYLLSDYLQGFVTEVGRDKNGVSVGISVKYHKP